MSNLNTARTARPTLERSGVNRILQVAFGIVLMGVILLVSAGRLDWPQAWIFLAFDVLTVLLIGTWMVRRDINLMNERGKIGKDIRGWDKVVVTLITVLYLALFVVAGLDGGRFHWSSVPPALQIVAFVGFIPAMALPWWAMSVNTYLSTIVRVQTERGHHVVTAGPYRYVRHPMYVGTILFGLCIPLFLGSWYALLPGALMGIGYVIRTALEDRTLQAELPGYADYAAQVRYRLLPGVW
jgi:protein-S-isoprenylcysteine O-methyltransferase Ste14